MTDSTETKSRNDTECEDGGCEKDAIAVYEGGVPPAGTVRYAACADHAPDAPPIRMLDEQLPAGGNA